MVFNGTGRISDKTKQLILKEAESLGYIHKPRNTKKSGDEKTVAILILIDPEWSFIWYFLTDMITQIDRDLSEQGLRTVLLPVSHHEDYKHIYQKITKLDCFSIFSIHFGNEQLFSRLEQDGIPVIMILNNNYQDKFFSICVDDFQGAYEGTRYLLELGHEEIVFVDSTREDLPNLSSDRYYGFLKAMEEEKTSVREDFRINCRTGWSEDELEAYFRSVMDRTPPPTAFFCLDDEIAIRVWNSLRNLGYSIPENISILAPGDVLDYSKPYIPQITTMHIDMKYIGGLAVGMLVNRLKNDSEAVHVLKVKQQLIERKSCRKPRLHRTGLL